MAYVDDWGNLSDDDLHLAIVEPLDPADRRELEDIKNIMDAEPDSGTARRNLSYAKTLRYAVRKINGLVQAEANPSGSRGRSSTQEQNEKYIKADISRKVHRTMCVIGFMQVACDRAMDIILFFVAKNLRMRSWKLQNGKVPDLYFERYGLDDEGRCKYRLKPDRSKPQQGQRRPSPTPSPPGSPTLRRAPSYVHGELHWEAKPRRGNSRWTCKVPEGDNPSHQIWLDAALPTDPGVWEGDCSGARVERLDAKPVSQAVVEELRDCFARDGDGSVRWQNIVDQVRSVVAGFLEEYPALADLFQELLSAMCKVCRRVNLPDIEVPKAKDPAQLFSTLVVLARRCAGEEVVQKLRKYLPEYDGADKKKEPLTQCMILTCRLLDICDLHDPEESILPRLVHRLYLAAWQHQHPKQLKILQMDNLDEGKVIVQDSKAAEPAAETLRDDFEQAVRFVVVSDTHGWDADLQLPDAEVLLHCGDHLFEAGHLDASGNVPVDLENFFDLLKTDRYKKYKWIFIVGGNHDQPLYDMWRDHKSKLENLLPRNVVLLQAYRDERALPLPSCALVSSKLEKAEEIRTRLQDGAVWLRPRLRGADMHLELRDPSEKTAREPGWILAGTGVSLPNNTWSANRAFQLEQGEDQRSNQQAAAKALLKHKPYIVMSHGPPEVNKSKGEPGWDEGKGDKELRTELDSTPETKIIIFGHKHGNHGCHYDEECASGRRAFVFASTCTQFYSPTRPPIMFKLSFQQQEPPQFQTQLVADSSRPFFAVADATETCISCLERMADCPKQCMGRAHNSEAMRLYRENLPRFYEFCRSVKAYYEHDTPIFQPRQNQQQTRQNQSANSFGGEDSFGAWFTAESGRGGPAHASRDNLPGGVERFRIDTVREPLLSDRREEDIGQQTAQHTLLEDWVPEGFPHEGVLEIWRKKQDDAVQKRVREAQEEVTDTEKETIRKNTKLSDFDVVGPAVLYAFQSVGHWFFAIGLTVVAYLCTKPPGADRAFADYPAWLWLLFLLVFAHLWNVQEKIMRYVVLAQVQQLGCGFKILGTKPSFKNFMRFIWGWSGLSLMDITNQCLFYGAFLVSAANNDKIATIWRITICQALEARIPVYRDIVSLFTVCWLCTFVQFIYMLCHVFTTEDKGVSYEFGSMAKGYHVMFSHVLGFQLHTPDTIVADQHSAGQTRGWWPWRWIRGASREAYKFWHADILRILAIYGRMSALTWEDRALMLKRLELEIGKNNAVRYLQIKAVRVKELVSRLLLVDILEKAFKLEVQITVFCIDLVLQPDQTDKWRSCNKQMLFAIFLSFLSTLYALVQHLSGFNVLFRLQRRCPEASTQNRQSVEDNTWYLNRFMGVYALLIFFFGVWFAHSSWKFHKAFACPFSMSNAVYGCVEFRSSGPQYNRTLDLAMPGYCPK